jgi:hypothetical protein
MTGNLIEMDLLGGKTRSLVFDNNLILNNVVNSTVVISNVGALGNTSISMSRNMFSWNKALVGGGLTFRVIRRNNFSPIRLDNNTFEGNMASLGGAVAILEDRSDTIAPDIETRIVFSNCSFNRNVAQRGGGIYHLYDNLTTLTLNDCVFSHNAANLGGGLFLAGNTSVILDCWPLIHRMRSQKCILVNNTAMQGGGLFAASRTFYNSSVVCDTATAFASSQIEFNSSSFQRNEALQGSAIFFQSNTLDSITLQDTNLYNNTNQIIQTSNNGNLTIRIATTNISLNEFRQRLFVCDPKDRVKLSISKTNILKTFKEPLNIERVIQNNPTGANITTDQNETKPIYIALYSGRAVSLNVTYTSIDGSFVPSIYDMLPLDNGSKVQVMSPFIGRSSNVSNNITFDKVEILAEPGNYSFGLYRLPITQVKQLVIIGIQSCNPPNIQYRNGTERFPRCYENRKSFCFVPYFDIL